MGTLNLNSGTITGLNAGGLPDASVQAADLASGVGGKFASYAVICDEKAHNTDGGSFTQGDWRDRDLNTELIDPDGIVSISSNQFTLGAGTYLIHWSAPAYRVEEHRTRLYDVTGSAVLEIGFNGWSADTDRPQGWSEGWCRHTITSNNVYKIQHMCDDTYSGAGMGRPGNIDDTVERYTWVKIYKEA